MALAASVAPQAFAPVEGEVARVVPVMVGTMLFSAPFPVLESVATIAEEVVPVGVLGNASDAVRDAAAAVPVPVRAAVWGEPVALSATDNVAESVAEAGVNIM